VEDFDEAAHVGAFIMVGQVDVHVDSGDRMLETVCLVQDNNGIFYILNPNLVDLNHPVVVHVLNINHGYCGTVVLRLSGFRRTP
jgi:hypothetical protein